MEPSPVGSSKDRSRLGRLGAAFDRSDFVSNETVFLQTFNLTVREHWASFDIQHGRARATVDIQRIGHIKTNGYN